MLRRERENRARRYIGVLVCVTLGITLGVVSNRMAKRKRTDPVTASVRTVTAPVAHGFVITTRWFGRQVGWLFHGRTLANENARLRKQNAALSEEVARLREADIAVQRLRQQLGFQPPTPFHRLAADVISLAPNPNFETMVISRGSTDHVQVGNVVVSSYGLIGHVTDVAPTSASVLLLTDPNSAVGAMVQRLGSRAAGVCKGTGGPTLSLLYLDRDLDVKVGDPVVSSGLGGEQGIFPKGIPIGTVTALRNDPSGAGRIVMVRPAVGFSQVEEVYVLQ